MNKEKIILINKLIKNLNNDSKRIAKNSKDQLDNIGIEHFQKIYNICKKIGYKYFYDYFGGTNVYFDWKEKNILYFMAGDDQEIISIEDLSDFDYISFEKEIKQKRIDHISDTILCLERELLSYKQELNNLEKELE